MEPDASDLLLFARVIEAGSFTRAAERVHLPKSTVSRRLAALEKRLGEKLLQRSTRKLALTEFGQGVLVHARALATEVDSALALAQHRQAMPSGRLRVSMPGDLAVLALTAMLAKFATDFPMVVLELDLSPRRVDLIGENFDLALRMGSLPEDSQLAARRLAVFEIGLYASPGYLRAHGDPTSPEALTGMHALKVLSRTGDDAAWHLTRGQGAGAERWTGEVSQRTVANSPDLLMRLALAGAGVTSGNDFFVGPHVKSGALVRVLPEWSLGHATAWAVFPGRRLMPTRTRVFLDALAETLAPCNRDAP
jgi:DNA-binding transcriptional LysR family regulator